MKPEDQFVPHIIVSDGLAALEFYKKVFGAVDGHNMMAQDGKRLMHGEIVLDGRKLFISDEFGPEEGGSAKTPEHLGGISGRVNVMVEDADAVVARAVENGATVAIPVQDMFWGARYGKIVDPFGHEWGINQKVAEQTPEDTEERAKEFFAQQNK